MIEMLVKLYTCLAYDCFVLFELRIDRKFCFQHIHVQVTKVMRRLNNQAGLFLCKACSVILLHGKRVSDRFDEKGDIGADASFTDLSCDLSLASIVLIQTWAIVKENLHCRGAHALDLLDTQARQ